MNTTMINNLFFFITGFAMISVNLLIMTIDFPPIPMGLLMMLTMVSMIAIGASIYRKIKNKTKAKGRMIFNPKDMIILSLATYCVYIYVLNFFNLDHDHLIIGVLGCIIGAIFLFYPLSFMVTYFLEKEKIRTIFQHYLHNQKWIHLDVSIKKDYVLILGKLLISLVTFSGFMLANSLYSLGMCFAKRYILKHRFVSLKDKWKVYHYVGLSIVLASIAYMIYSIRLLYTHMILNYTLEMGLVIAVYTFTEIFLVMRQLIKARRKNDIETEQIKLVNIASMMICIVLTQTALMSAKSNTNLTSSVAISGIFFSLLSMLIGVYMVIKFYFNHQND